MRSRLVYIGEADNVGTRGDGVAQLRAARSLRVGGLRRSRPAPPPATSTNLGTPKYAEARSALAASQEGVYAPGDVTPLGIRTGAGVNG